jgi:L-asparagine oxygenase
MGATFKEEVIRRGYIFLSQYSRGMDTIAVANTLGQPMTPWMERFVQELIPREIGTPNTYSGIYGLDGFPFHTDLAHWRLPPRYLLLRCIRGHTEIPTLVLDGRTVLETVTLDVLTRAICKPRRPQEGTFRLLRLCDPTDDGYRFRWDEVFLRPASKVGDVAYQRVRELLLASTPLSIPLAQPGDTLLVDNWRMLHARSPIPPERHDRRIQRIYLESLH